MNDALKYKIYLEQQRNLEKDNQKFSNGNIYDFLLALVLIALGRWYYQLLDAFIEGDDVRLYGSIALCLFSLFLYYRWKVYIQIALGLVLLVGLGIEAFKLLF